MNQAPPRIRLYVPAPFTAGATLALSLAQSHYLMHVMRCQEGEAVAVFNGQDGEWLAHIAAIAKKSVTLSLQRQLAAQHNSPDLWLAFAPIKNKTDLVVEKATELGVSILLPVLTQHTVVKSINHDKLLAHAVEAAEQCGRQDVPRIEPCQHIEDLLAHWPQDRLLLYGDESGGGIAMKELLHALYASQAQKYALLIGPEGGFSPAEHRMLKQSPFVHPFGLGPRILRADTAAVAALACLQMMLGDWEEQPHFAQGNAS